MSRALRRWSRPHVAPLVCSTSRPHHPRAPRVQRRACHSLTHTAGYLKIETIEPLQAVRVWQAVINDGHQGQDTVD